METIKKLSFLYFIKNKRNLKKRRRRRRRGNPIESSMHQMLDVCDESINDEEHSNDDTDNIKENVQ